jgi:hypothetical protein
MDWNNIIDQWIRDVSPRDSSAVEKLLGVSVGRVLKARFADPRQIIPPHGDGHMRYLWKTFGNDVAHIRDWLAGAVVRQDAWLTRVNSDGVPMKLAKFGRLDQIVDEANKAMRKLNSKGITGTDAGNVVHEFANGYSIVKLTTPELLEMESVRMQHCVGHGGYHQAVATGAAGIFSLRDQLGRPHATIEVDLNEDEVQQVKGKQNELPRADYFEMIAEWLGTQRFQYTCDDLPPDFVADYAGKIVRISSLKDGDTFDGNLKLELSEGSTLLPQNLTVTGDLTIRGKIGIFDARLPMTELPLGLTVGKVLYLLGLKLAHDSAFPGRTVYLDDCAIERLPPHVGQTITITQSEMTGAFQGGTVFESLVCISASRKLHHFLAAGTFSASLNLDNIGLLEIPDGLFVAGDVKITRSQVYFMGGIGTGGFMVINDSQVEGCPYQMSIGGTLHVHRSKMYKLPDSTAVGGDLILSSVELLNTLPRSVEVRGNITIDDTLIRSLEGRRMFNGNLELKRSPITHMEADTVIKGSLTINRIPIERLPQGLVVGGDLTIGSSPIKRIPQSTQVGGNLDLRGSTVVAVPENFQIVGNLDISEIGAFRIPKGVMVGGSLLAWKSGLEELPSDIRVRDIMAGGSRLARLPSQLAIDGHLDVSGTSIYEVPTDLAVGGNADFRRTRIQEFPASASIGGELEVDPEVVVHEASVVYPGQPRRFG